MNRRAAIRAVGAGIGLLPGCLEALSGSGSQEPTPPGPTPTATPPQTTPTPSPDAVLEFEVRHHDRLDLPAVVEDRLRDGNRWVAVVFTVVEGRVDMGDLWHNSVLVGREARYSVDPGTAELEEGIRSRGSLPVGASATVLYQLPEFEPDDHRWDLGALDGRVVADRR